MKIKNIILFFTLVSPLLAGTKENFETLKKQRDAALEKSTGQIQKSFVENAEKMAAEALRNNDLDTATKIKQEIAAVQKEWLNDSFDSVLFENVWDWKVEGHPEFGNDNVTFSKNGKIYCPGVDSFVKWEKVDEKTIKIFIKGGSSFDFELSKMDKKFSQVMGKNEQFKRSLVIHEGGGALSKNPFGQKTN